MLHNSTSAETLGQPKKAIIANVATIKESLRYEPPWPTPIFNVRPLKHSVQKWDIFLHINIGTYIP